MKKLFALLCIMCLSFPLFAQGVEEIHVSNVAALVNALRSNRVIVIDNDIDFGNELTNLNYYNSEALPLYREYEEGDKRKIDKMKNHPYMTEEFDGPQLVLKSIHNLTIKGSDKNGRTLLRISPRYAYVLKFVDCKDITISNLVMGHTDGGYCEGGVLGFVECANISINACDMYGCGMEGLYCKDVNNLKMTNSYIRDCTYDIMTLEVSNHIEFDNCLFFRNKEYSMFEVSSCENVIFRRCHIFQNRGPLFQIYGEKVVVDNCTISHDFGNLGTMECVKDINSTWWNEFGVKRNEE